MIQPFLSILHRLMRRGFFGYEDIDAFVLFVGGEDLLLVVAALGVDLPGVEFRATEEAEGGVVAGEHGVVLVIVAVHAVAADGLEIREAVEIGAEGVHMRTVFGIVDGVGVEFADDMAFQAEVGFFGEAQAGDFFFSKCDELDIGHRPEVPLPHLRVEGLMTMAPFSENPDSARPVFEGLRKLRDALSTASGHPLKELSMGMSGDFEQGILEGATIVRIGSAIFGSRSIPTGP